MASPCCVRSHLVPVEHYQRLESAVDRAFREVFGAEGDTAALRDLLVAGVPPTPAMPPAEAALIALRGLRTDIADAVLERARHYYSAPMGGPGRPSKPSTLPTM